MSFVLPLMSVILKSSERLELCAGCYVAPIPRDLVGRMEEDGPTMGGYRFSKDPVGLYFDVDELNTAKKLNHFQTQKLAVFTAMCIRLSTGIPIDVPFWLDIREKDLRQYGRTMIRTFRTGNDYTYPIDEGLQRTNLDIYCGGIPTLTELYTRWDNKHRLLRAIEFASIGFQTFHAPTRLVNHVTYMECLFAGSTAELSFRLAAALSWYLAAGKQADEREAVFQTVKDIYDTRSKVVHGNPSRGKTHLGVHLEQVEMLNTEIFNAIILRRHIELLGRNDDHYAAQLRKLALGLPGDFLETIKVPEGQARPA